jgi:chromosome segregation ATPase
MRDRDFEGLSGIRATEGERAYANVESDSGLTGMRASARFEPSGQGAGLLWAVCGALILCMIGLGYWSHREQTRLQQQLVATQTSFARVSEQAANRLEDITGKVTATESSMSEMEQSRRALEGLDVRLRDLVQRVNEQSQVIQHLEQGRENLTASDQARRTSLEALDLRAAELVGRVDAFDAHSQSLVGQLAAVQNQIAALDGRLAGLDALSRQLAAQDQRLADQQKQLEALTKKTEAQDIQRDLVAIRGELDQRLSSIEQEMRSIDSFRIQTNRTLSTLQTQMRTFQQGVEP